MDARTLTYTGISILGFGVWGFMMKLGQERLGAIPHLTAMGVFVALIVVLGLASRALPVPELNFGLWLPLGAALATLVAMLFLTLALGTSTGNTAAVVALSAVYPGITAILAAMFLGEAFTLAKVGGLLCAAAAAFLFTR
jgi:drug/metabolite transporter (DMT)-like permease